VDEIVAHIRDEIVEGRIAPGQRLEQEIWAERIGVSRSHLRLGLERLEAEGFVQLLPRRGAVVTEMTIEHIEDVLTTRLVLDAALGRAGAHKITDEELARLGEISDELQQLSLPDDHARLIELAHEFHVDLYRAAGSVMMTRFASQVTDHTYVFLNRLWHANRRVARSSQAYIARLFDAINLRELDRVERLMRDHRIDLAATVFQGRIRARELGLFSGVLNEAELDRFTALIDDDGQT
jgi:DNA-binding GntR family transcriptional regulator